MRIAVDGRLLLPSPTGIGRVVYNTLKALISLDTEHEYSVLCPPGLFAELAGHSRFHRVETEIAQYSPRVFTGLPELLRGSDLVHFPYFFHPYRLPIPYVVSIFDTVYSCYPQSLSAVKRAVYEITMRLSIRNASLVLTHSECARADIISFFRAPASKVRVAPLGVEERFRPHEDREKMEFRCRRGLPDRFILYVGNHKPHKNVPSLVDALSRIRKDVSCSLLLLDDGGDDCRRTRATVEAAGMSDRVVFLRDLPDSELPLLYNSADVFVFPSLYEGFGLPPLEAMACGTPVVTSNASSLPEVVGDAGIMVDPHSVEELADAILKVLRDADIRDRMISKGFERAKDFSWQETARRTLNVYEDAWQGKGIAGREGSNSPRFPKPDGRR